MITDKILYVLIQIRWNSSL